MHASIGTFVVINTMAGLKEQTRTLMHMIFTLLQTPEERDLSAYVEASGGPEKVFGNDELLKNLWKKQKSREDARAKRTGQAEQPVNLVEIRADIRKDIEQILKVRCRSSDIVSHHLILLLSRITKRRSTKNLRLSASR
jgi:hypothetical protein